MIRRLGLLLIPWMLASCSKSELGVTKEDLVRQLSTGVILTHYRDFADAATLLALRAADFQATTDGSTLDALQAAWRDARKAWGVCEAHFCGPEEDLFLNTRVDTFPVSTSLLEGIVSGTDTLTEAYVQTLGSTRRGLLAIEYFIFDAAGMDSAVVAAMTTGTDAARRLLFVLVLCQNLETVAKQIRDLWEPAAGDFATKFGFPGSAGSPYSGAQAALDDLVNRMIAFAEYTADNRLGIPLGVANGGSGIPDPSKVEASIADSSREDLLADVRGFQAIYAVLAPYVRQTSPEIDRTLQRAIDQAFAAVTAIPEPLDLALTGAPAACSTAYAALKELKNRITIDLVAVFQSTLTFSPFDGD